MCAGNGDASWDGGGGGPTSDSPGSGTPPFGASAPSSPPPLCNQDPPFLNKAFRRLAISDDASIVRLKDVASRSAWFARFSATLLSEYKRATALGAAARAA